MIKFEKLVMKTDIDKLHAIFLLKKIYDKILSK